MTDTHQSPQSFPEFQPISSEWMHMDFEASSLTPTSEIDVWVDEELSSFPPPLGSAMHKANQSRGYLTSRT